MKILRALMRDGRASYREIATRTSLTTPTVSLRLSRMGKGGLVRGFEPVIEVDRCSGKAKIILLETS